MRMIALGTQKENFQTRVGTSRDLATPGHARLVERFRGGARDSPASGAMPGDIRSFFGGGGAKNPASPKPPAAPEAKADVAMVDLTDDPPAPASGNKRKAQDAVDVRARSSLRVSRAVGDVLGGCLPPSGLSANPRRTTRSETTNSHRKKTEPFGSIVARETRRVFLSIPPRVV